MEKIQTSEEISSKPKASSILNPIKEKLIENTNSIENNINKNHELIFEKRRFLFPRIIKYKKQITKDVSISMRKPERNPGEFIHKPKSKPGNADVNRI